MSSSFLTRSRRLASPMIAVLALIVLGVAPNGQAQTYTALSDIQGSPSAQNPLGVIAQGRDGNMYAVSATGGTFYGTVFKFNTSGTVSVVYDIGYFPWGGLTLGTDGQLYGEDSDGGVVGNCGLSASGQVYKITTAGTLTILHNFTGTGDGCNPQGQPIEGANGIFYGTTLGPNNGTAYSVTSGGTFTNLHTFTGTDGSQVYAPLVQGTDGNFYGNTVYGGTDGDGVIFKMTATGTVTVLHNFNGAADGAHGYYGLIQATDGNFYGVAQGDGTMYGTVFKMTPGGVYTVLHTFTGEPSDGASPGSSLLQGSDGKLYGVTAAGGTSNGGTIFSLTTSGGSSYSVLYNFADSSTTGYNPASPLIENTDGTFYGTTYYGGLSSTCNCGVVYSFSNGLKAYASLLSTSGAEGAKIGILGQGFGSTTTVKFGGTQAVTVTRTGSTYLTATVPAAALTGSVTVTTGSTVLTSSQSFRVTPTMKTFSPTSGAVGALVTITGTGLDQTTRVTFSGKSAAFTVVSDTEVTATVPTGAKTGKIIVTTKGGSVTSASNFTVN
jgi:uncharacterized repeat protein (TIGR03803 family)